MKLRTEFSVTFPNRAFTRWEDLHVLLQRAFAFMEGRIDPPSSLGRMTVEDVSAKAGSEWLGTVEAGGSLIGCAFVRPEPALAYIGKVAVSPEWQGRGVGRALFGAIEIFARERDIPLLELQTRIELIENHAAFSALGFVRVHETAHPGYDRPTSITMQKRLR